MADVPGTWWAGDRWRAYERACGLADAQSRLAVLRMATWRTRVVDLRQDEAALWRGVRKGYRAPIVRGQAQHAIAACGADDMEAFHQMHAEEAGRETRPAETWDMMADWLRDGHLLLVGARAGRYPYGWAGFAAFYRWGHWAYYGSAATQTRDVGHALIWAAMLALKSAGVTRLELGWQGQDRTPKGEAIEFFRRGFGGFDVPAAKGSDAW